MDEATAGTANELGMIKVDWKNVPKLNELKNDFKEAKPYHDEQVVRLNKWLDNLHVRNKAQVKTGPNRSKIVPKLIRKQAEWRYPALSDPFLVDEDIFKVSPMEASDKAAAHQNSLILNYQFNNDIEKVDFFDELSRAVVDEGTALIFIGWEAEEEEYQEIEPVFQLVPNPEYEETLIGLAEMKAQSPDNYDAEVPYELQGAVEAFLATGVAREPRITGSREVTKTRMLVNRPALEICNLENVVVDPSCNGNLKKAGFVVRSFEADLSTLTKDGRYMNLDKLNVKDMHKLSDPEFKSAISDGVFNFKDKARKKFVVREYWGFWDIDGTGVVKPFVAAWVNNVLIRMERNPFPHQELPFVNIRYLPVRKSIYGEPDGELLEDNQRISGAVVRGILDVMGQSANGQTGMRKDMLDPVNKMNFESGRNYMFNPTADPRQGIYQHQYPETPQAAYTMLQMQNMDAEALTGVKAFSSGLTGEAFGDVAAGTKGVLDAASKREVAILRRIGAGVIEIGRKIIAMNAAFLSEKETIRITNEEFVDISRDGLEAKAGKFDLKLTISTAEENDARATRLEFTLQTMGNNVPFDYSKEIWAEVATLRKIPDLAKWLRNYKPEPDPMQQQIQQLEIQKLQAEIAEIQARTQGHMTGANLDMAKANTEGAKASELGAKTSRAALDYVQEESGVNQERELQKQKAQSEGNIELKKTEHALKTGEEMRKEEKVDIQKFLDQYMRESGDSGNTAVQ